MGKSIMRKRLVLLSLSVVLVGVLGGGSVATGSAKRVRAHAASTTAATYGPLSPTFVGPAATGCASGCSLLTGPFTTGSTASSSASTYGGEPEGRGRIVRSPRDACPRPLRGAARRRAVRARPQTHAAATPVIPNSQVPAARRRLRHDQHLGGRGDRREGPERGRQRLAQHEPQRAISSRPTRGCAPATDTSSRRTTSARSWSSTPR